MPVNGCNGCILRIEDLQSCLANRIELRKGKGYQLLLTPVSYNFNVIYYNMQGIPTPPEKKKKKEESDFVVTMRCLERTTIIMYRSWYEISCFISLIGDTK